MGAWGMYSHQNDNSHDYHMIFMENFYAKKKTDTVLYTDSEVKDYYKKFTNKWETLENFTIENKREYIEYVISAYGNKKIWECRPCGVSGSGIIGVCLIVICEIDSDRFQIDMINENKKQNPFPEKLPNWFPTGNMQYFKSVLEKDVNEAEPDRFNDWYFSSDTGKRTFKKGSGYERFLKAKKNEATLFGFKLDCDIENMIFKNYNNIY